MEHTPTPWAIYGSHVYSPGNGNICEMSTPRTEGGTIEHVALDYGNPQRDEAIANARMIVRAVNAYPDLLAVCEAAKEALRSLPLDALGFGVSSDGQFEWPIKSELENDLTAAIARARGEGDAAITPQPLEPEMVLIPAGEFLMGSDPEKDQHAYDTEQPQHTVFLSDYYIAKTPVTNVQYLAFVEATGHDYPHCWNDGKPPEGKEDHPVVNVTWHDAMAYCRWLAETTGKDYRLPSEAEWEKAARGTDGRIYPWGDEPPDETRCNFGNNVGDTTPVSQYSPGGDSSYGCMDMAGNVWEWTRSQDRDYPYDPEDGRKDPRGSSPRVLRGGAFGYDQWYVRCAYRGGYFPDGGSGSSGFRFVLAPGL